VKIRKFPANCSLHSTVLEHNLDPFREKVPGYQLNDMRSKICRDSANDRSRMRNSALSPDPRTVRGSAIRFAALTRTLTRLQSFAWLSSKNVRDSCISRAHTTALPTRPACPFRARNLLRLLIIIRSHETLLRNHRWHNTMRRGDYRYFTRTRNNTNVCK